MSDCGIGCQHSSHNGGVMDFAMAEREKITRPVPKTNYCKNCGYQERRHGSAFCQECSDKHNK